MNIEEKLKAAKRLYQTANSDQKYVLESLFPELKESEDERIRKELITFFQRFPYDSIESAGTNPKEAIAWLEKQGEQTINQPDFEIPFGAKDSELIEESYYIPKGYHAEIIKDRVTIKKGEQKPAWSAEDMFKVQRICEYLCEAKKYYADIPEVRDCIEWLKSLKQRIGG